MQVSMISNINKTSVSQNFGKFNNISFLRRTTADVFEKQQISNTVIKGEQKNNYIDGLHLYNPLGYYPIDIDTPIDITKPQKFEIKKKKFWGGYNASCKVEFDPKKKGQLVDKKTGKPIDVFILKLHDSYIDSFHFVSKDFQHEYGHVEFSYDMEAYSEAYTKDYSKENIIGDRIIVSWLKNEDDEHIGGVGKLADKVAVKYCVENNITPNIVSLAGDDSHLAHYSRGKRFIQPGKYSNERAFLMGTYGTKDPNQVLEKLLKKSKQTGEKIDLSDWNEYYFMMYLPQDLVEKYKNEDY